MLYTQKKEFLESVKKPDKAKKAEDGYIVCPSYEVSDEITNKNYSLRVALLQSEQAFLAANILAEIFEGFEIRYLFIQNQEGSAQVLNQYSSSVALPLKELYIKNPYQCVFDISIKFDRVKNRYQRTAEELKCLILRAWRALQQADIQLSYILTQNYIGIRASFECVCPFSYIAKKNHSNLSGAMPTGSYFLADIEISIQDLIQFSIDIEQVKKSFATQVNSFKKDYHKAEINIKEALESVKAQIGRDVIEELHNLYKFIHESGNESIDKIEKLKDIKQQLDILLCDYPRQLNYKLEKLEVLVEFQRVYQLILAESEKNLDVVSKKPQSNPGKHYDEFEKGLAKLFQSLEATTHITTTIEAFQRDSWINEFLEHEGFGKSLPNIVVANPAKMQIIFWQLQLIKQLQNNFSSKLMKNMLSLSGELALDVTSKWQQLQPSSNSYQFQLFLTNNDVKTMARINLSFADLTDTEALQLKQDLSSNLNLIHINLEGNPISQEIKNEITLFAAQNFQRQVDAIFSTNYKPELSYKFCAPLLDRDKLRPAPSEQARSSITLQKIKAIFLVNDVTAKQLVIDAHERWLKNNDIEKLRLTSAEEVKQAIFSYIFYKLRDKVGAIGGRTVVFKTKKVTMKLLLATHVAKMIKDYQDVDIEPEKFIKNCIAYASEVNSVNNPKSQLSWLWETPYNQRDENVKFFDKWLQAINIPAGTIFAMQPSYDVAKNYHLT